MRCSIVVPLVIPLLRCSWVKPECKPGRGGMHTGYSHTGYSHHAMGRSMRAWAHGFPPMALKAAVKAMGSWQRMGAAYCCFSTLERYTPRAQIGKMFLMGGGRAGRRRRHSGQVHHGHRAGTRALSSGRARSSCAYPPPPPPHTPHQHTHTHVCACTAIALTCSWHR